MNGKEILKILKEEKHLVFHFRTKNHSIFGVDKINEMVGCDEDGDFYIYAFRPTYKTEKEMLDYLKRHRYEHRYGNFEYKDDYYFPLP